MLAADDRLPAYVELSWISQGNRQVHRTYHDEVCVMSEDAAPKVGPNIYRLYLLDGSARDIIADSGGFDGNCYRFKMNGKVCAVFSQGIIGYQLWSGPGEKTT
jgi:hypothetical protein